ncbi:ogr/Delta-like zinc finger family protein [Yersinia canariae]|uniref:ogr/Delta-like zinc finger family protein n=1 Tax=Yersinia canariae TaxID=2607663 RepID=UPI0011AAE4D8|nr:ogr/Delta-like zinc finger family protein [Yersinia canariae]
MFNCPLCHSAAHTRSSSQITTETKERYHQCINVSMYQCINVNCGHTFVTMESFMRSISKPGEINPVLPHPQTGGQVVMF